MVHHGLLIYYFISRAPIFFLFMESWTHFLKITALNLKSRITDFATILIIKKDLSYKSKGPVCSEVTLYTIHSISEPDSRLYRKILLDANEDKVQKNSQLARRKEEATVEAKHEIKNLILREMTLKSEVICR